MANALIPINGQIIIEPIERAEMRESSIKGFEFQSPKMQGVPFMGVVYAIDPNLTDLEFAVGDKLIYDEPSPKGFKYDNRKLVAVKLDQVAAVIK